MSLALAEVYLVAHFIYQMPEFFTARLILAPIWSLVKSLSSGWLLIPAGIFMALLLLPRLLAQTKSKYQPVFNRIGIISIIISLLFFPIAHLIKNAQNIGPLWSLLFFVFAGFNLIINERDYFYSACISAFIWDMGAGVQGLMRSISYLPEPYFNSASPEFVLTIDLTAILGTLTLWVKGFDPNCILENLISKFQGKKLTN